MQLVCHFIYSRKFERNQITNQKVSRQRGKGRMMYPFLLLCTLPSNAALPSNVSSEIIQPL
jgi:hypothetical protein